MRIGTITFWDTEDNYGQVLQCFALIKYLESRGHQVQLVKTDQSDLYEQSYIHKLYTLLDMVIHPSRFFNRKKCGETQKSQTHKARFVDRYFSDFKKKYIPSTEKIYTFRELCKADLGLNAVVCGSDQVWSGFSKLMFLQFPGTFKRISYAASFGGVRPKNGLDKKNVRSWLKSFDLITVREKEGVEICGALKAKAYMVPDPTLLLGKIEYDKLIETPKEVREEEYILLYLLGNEMKVTVEEIMAFAKSKHLKVKYVASQNRVDELGKEYPTIGEWLYLMSHASYFITNSFHGTVFSMIFHKPFMTIPLSGKTARMNGRIADLLTDSGLEERIFTGSFETLFKPLDFDKFEENKRRGIVKVNNLLEETGL